MERISVIVAVYNVEKYVEKCLQSICAQTYKNLEIIVIDDGSIDESGTICDKMAELDSRIRVIHQQNAGVSAARNMGIRLATGKYIAFVDGDDYLDLNMYDTLYSYLKQNDVKMAVCSFYYVYANKIKTEKRHESPRKYSRNEYLKLLLRDSFSFYFSVVWNKLISIDVLKTNELFFDETLNIMEDFKYSLEILTKLDSLAICSTPLYFYRRNNECSVTKVKYTFEQSYYNRMAGGRWLKECVQQCNMDKKSEYWIADYMIRYLALQYSKALTSDRRAEDLVSHRQISRRESIKVEMKNVPALFKVYRKVYWNSIYLWEKLLEKLRSLKS